MDADVVIRGGSVVDGTGSPARRADVAIAGERIVAVEPDYAGGARRTIDAAGKIVTPGFVDIHTHLDAQLAWDPVGTSSCWHGITSVVLGNCGVTFAPVNPGDREMLAEMMESVEDIPRRAILEGLPWDWSTYGEYLGFLDRMPKGLNVGGMVGHCAVRVASMGERCLDEAPASAADIAAMCEHVEEAMQAGALGFSTSRTLGHRVPDGRPVPGTWAQPEELIAIGDVLGRLGRGVFESASRLGERDGDELTATRAELAWMGEVSRRSGRPLSFGLAQSNRRPGLYHEVVNMAKEQNALGAVVRPQTTARGIGILTTLDNRTPFDRSAPWAALRGLPLADKLTALRERREELIAAGVADPGTVPMDRMWVLMPGAARYDCRPDTTLAAVAAQRGVSPVEAFVDL
jgi:N-acyl-D-amino-acid deacylase